MIAQGNVKLPLIRTLTGGIQVYLNDFLRFTFISFIFMAPLCIGVALLPNEPDTTLYVGLLIIRFFMFIVGAVITGAVICGVFRKLNNQSLGIGKSLRLGLIRILPLLGVAFMTSIPANLFSFSWQVFLPAWFDPLDYQDPLKVLRIMRYFRDFAHVLIVAWVYSVFIASAPAVVAERRGVIASLKRSIFLTRGHRRRVFFIFFILEITGYLVRILIPMIFPGAEIGETASETISQVVRGGIALIFYTLHAVMAAFIYRRLLMLMEGYRQKALAAIFA